MSAMVLASASLALAPGLAGGQLQGGSEEVTNGAKQPGQGATGTAQAGGKTAKGAGRAGDIGDRLHDSAKGFGEAILDGIKYAGRTVIGFFNDDKRTE
jgi:hypothetical protein